VLPDRMKALLDVDPAEWVEAVAAQEEFFHQYGNRLPKEIHDEQQRLARAVAHATASSDIPPQ
jgi:phosphoenolpyruvate carboxykinase (GTP)